jgi:hypothetical protein
MFTKMPPSVGQPNTSLGATEGLRDTCGVAAPVGAENLCNQAILMNHTPDTVASPDSEMINVGDGFG